MFTRKPLLALHIRHLHTCSRLAIVSVYSISCCCCTCCSCTKHKTCHATPLLSNAWFVLLTTLSAAIITFCTGVFCWSGRGSSSSSGSGSSCVGLCHSSRASSSVRFRGINSSNSCCSSGWRCFSFPSCHLLKRETAVSDVQTTQPGTTLPAILWFFL